MSNNKKNVNNATKEEVKETKVETPQDKGGQNNVQNPPVAVDQPTPEKKSWFAATKEKIADAFDAEKHPIRNKVAVVGGKVAKGAALVGVGAIATVGILAYAGTKSKQDDSDDDDQYDDYDAEDEEDDEDVVDSEAKELDE